MLGIAEPVIQLSFLLPLFLSLLTCLSAFSFFIAQVAFGNDNVLEPDFVFPKTTSALELDAFLCRLVSAGFTITNIILIFLVVKQKEWLPTLFPNRIMHWEI